MDIIDKNELQTHQGMDSRHMQKINCSDKKYREIILLSINIVIDDKTYIQCKQSIHVHDFGGKYLCISNKLGSFNLIISKTNHVSFTLKGIP